VKHKHPTATYDTDQPIRTNVSTNSPIDSLFHFYEKLGVIVLTLTISNVTNPNPNPIERHENNKVVFIYVICSI